MYVTQNLYDCKYKYNYICMYPCLINMKVLDLKNFIEKYIIKNDTMNEYQLQKL